MSVCVYMCARHVGRCEHSRLQSFLSEVMEEREETLILPPWRLSTGLACFRKRLYSSLCRGVSLQVHKETARAQNTIKSNHALITPPVIIHHDVLLMLAISRRTLYQLILHNERHTDLKWFIVCNVHQEYLQQTTCSIFTGRYLESMSEVLLIRHLENENILIKQSVPPCLLCPQNWGSGENISNVLYIFNKERSSVRDHSLKRRRVLPVDNADELFQFLLSSSPVFITGISIPTLQNGNLKALLKFLSSAWVVWRSQKFHEKYRIGSAERTNRSKVTPDDKKKKILTKDSGIDKVHQAEVLQQVILNGSSRYEYPSLSIHSIQCLVRLIVRILQAVALSKKKKKNQAIIEMIHVQ